MKPILCTMFAFFVIVCLSPCAAFAAETVAVNEDVVYFEDGSYIVTIAEEIVSRASGIKTQTKSRTYYDSNDVAEWKITLTGIFSYNGSSATCTESTCSVDVYASNWYLISKTAEKSSNIASCTVTLGKTFLGITISKPVHTLTIVCDKDGNFT